jgi:hypothetical protein
VKFFGEVFVALLVIMDRAGPVTLFTACPEAACPEAACPGNGTGWPGRQRWSPSA